MFSRLRSTSLGHLIELASPRSDSNVTPTSSPNPLAPHHNSAPRQRLTDPVFTSISEGRPSLHPNRHSLEAQFQKHQALERSKGALREAVESLQKIHRDDLSQRRAILAMMAAILSDGVECRDCMRENGGFLTLVTVLASLIQTDSSQSASYQQNENLVSDERLCDSPTPRRSKHVKTSSIGIGAPPRRSLHSKNLSSSTSSSIGVISRERDAVVELIFKCLALALTGNPTNQQYFSTVIGYQSLLDAIRISELLPRDLSSSYASEDQPYDRVDHIQSAYKMFDIIFSFITGNFTYSDVFTSVLSTTSTSGTTNQMNADQNTGRGYGDVTPTKLRDARGTGRNPSYSTQRDQDDIKYRNMSSALSLRICQTEVPPRVEIPDAVRLMFALHSDLLFPLTQTSFSDSAWARAAYELYFLSLKAIECLASTSRHSQVSLNSAEVIAILLERIITPMPNLANSTGSTSKPTGMSHGHLPSLTAGLEPWPESLILSNRNKSPIDGLGEGERRCRMVIKDILLRLLEIGCSTREARLLFRQMVVSSDTTEAGNETLDDEYLELVLSGMQSSCWPPFIHFDLSRSASSSVFLQSIGDHPFPPTNGKGWTFAGWIQVESFDTANGVPLNILQLSDPNHGPIIRVSLSNTPQSHHLTVEIYPQNIQNQPTTPRRGFETKSTSYPQSRHVCVKPHLVEFKEFLFRPQRFYHVALVQKPKDKMNTSMISLFIDGESVGQYSCPWPRSATSSVSACFGDLPPIRHPDTAPSLSPTVCSECTTSSSGSYPSPQRTITSRWNLAASWLFNQHLSDDMIFVQSTLGPKIFTTWQDALGSFQTYSSSTLLNLKIDQLQHQITRELKTKSTKDQSSFSRQTKKADTSQALNNSPLIKAIRESASAFIPHNSMYFALSSQHGMVAGIPRGQDYTPSEGEGLKKDWEQINDMGQSPQFVDSVLLRDRDLSTLALSHRRYLNFADSILNAGIPNIRAIDLPLQNSQHDVSSAAPGATLPSSLSHALFQISGVTLCSPKGLDDSIWKVAGSIFLVKLISLSSTEPQLLSTIKMFFEAISHNWRLSEDAEKIQAYETLAYILRNKSHLISEEIHRVLLLFAGIVTEGPPTSTPAQKSEHPFPTLENTTLDDETSQVDRGLQESVITNPLAFRFLLLDFDLWSRTTSNIQEKHFKSLSYVIEKSRWSAFSSKRISKMNLIPKMLHALRTRQFALKSERPSVMPAFIGLLSCVLKVQFNTDSIRGLASYLTASLSPQKMSPNSTAGTCSSFSLNSPQSVSPDSPFFDPTQVQDPKSTSSDALQVPQAYIKPMSTSITIEEPLMVLETLHNLLLSANDQESRSYISRFLKAINGSKWVLMFFRRNSKPEVILYSYRILIRLIQTQDIVWIQQFKNTLSGFAILRSILTEFSFCNPSILVATLSLIAQVDIRTVPIFNTQDVSPEEMTTVIRSIEGIPSDTIAREMLPVVLALLKPVYVIKQDLTITPALYVLEWLRVQSKNERWNEIIGHEDMLQLWGPYVTMLASLSNQDNVVIDFDEHHGGMSSASNKSASDYSCLRSFPLNITSLSSSDGDPSPQVIMDEPQSIQFIVDEPGKLSPPSVTPPSNRRSSTVHVSIPRRQTTRGNRAAPHPKIIIPQTITINGEAISLPTSPDGLNQGAQFAYNLHDIVRESRFQRSHAMEDETDPRSTTLSSWEDIDPEVGNRLSSLAKELIIYHVFQHVVIHQPLPPSDDAGFVTSMLTDKRLRLDRLERLLNLVVTSNGLEQQKGAWITPLFDDVISMAISETDSSTLPLNWLIPTLAHGYIAGWLQPTGQILSDLITFVVDTTKSDQVPWLAELLLIALSSRTLQGAEILLEQLSSHRLAGLIKIAPDLASRLVYLMTQYISGSTELCVLACDVLKSTCDSMPMCFDELQLDLDDREDKMPRFDSGSVENCEVVESAQSEKDSNSIFIKFLQMNVEEITSIVHNQASKNLAGKLDWIQFVTELEVKGNVYQAKSQSISNQMWTEYRNKTTIESRKLDAATAKMHTWAKRVRELDAARYADIRQDNHEIKQYLEIQLSKRISELYRPFAVLGKSSNNTPSYWFLDTTEGPSRQRRKLRRVPIKVDTHIVQQRKTRHHRVRSLGTSRRDSYQDVPDSHKHVETMISDVQSPSSPTVATMTEHDTWNENDGLTASPAGGLNSLGSNSAAEGVKELSVDFAEDRSRRILKSLEPGDVIQAVWNVEQVIGLDTCPGLFLIAKNNIYIIDGFIQTSKGELVNSWQSEAWEERDPHLRMMATLSRQTAKLNSRAAAHQSRRWSYTDIVALSSRKWLFRDICIEFVFADGRSRLLTFSGNKRDEAMKRLRDCIAKSTGSEHLYKRESNLKSQTELWQSGQLSNHGYLLYLNDAAGRTYRDLTQHPVFPWILADYGSKTLDLKNPATFRKLALPMGAQTEPRKRDFIERYTSLEEFGAIGDDKMKPAHYMTHYSSAVVVCGFMIRLQPFCDHFLEIQGSFDHADRTFWSMERAWLSASEQSRSDVRELTPEFFHCPEFLKNINNFNLGSRQEGGTPIDDVELPPWAHRDPRLFVELHREALESDYVSENLHHWIDLIFGFKQRGQAALDAINVFQECSYEGSVSLDNIHDESERSSVVGAMCNWGLTPSQIFSLPHPPRGKQAKHAFDSKSVINSSTCSALVQSIVPLQSIGQPISHIHPAAMLEKTTVSGLRSLLVPPNGTHRLDWGFLDQSLRIFDSSGALCGTFEGITSEEISAACFADHRTLATASTDSTISLWRFTWRLAGRPHLQQVEVLRGHSAPITCLATSRVMSIILSGCADGLAMIWDLNRALLVRSLPHPTPVTVAAISESTGDIATCSELTVRIWSINGDLLSTLMVSQHHADFITACAWSTAEVKPLLITGHRSGKIMMWQRKSAHGESLSNPWKMDLIQVFQQESGCCVTALALSNRVMLVGDALGRLFSWALPGSAVPIPDAVSSICMVCDHKFGILEGRRRCLACAAIICSSCQDCLPGSVRCCVVCVARLTNYQEPKQ